MDPLGSDGVVQMAQGRSHSYTFGPRQALLIYLEPDCSDGDGPQDHPHLRIFPIQFETAPSSYHDAFP